MNYSSFGSSVEYTSNGLLLDYGTPLWQSSSSVIYGGMYVNSTLTDHAGSLFFGGGFADGTQVRLNPANGSYQLGDQVTTLCLFKEDDFIDPVSTGFVYAFEAGSNSFSGSITYDPRGAAQGELNEDVFDRGEIRWVIQNDNQYFISEVVSSFTNSITFFNVNSDVFTLDWFNYDPYGLGTIESANYISIVGNSVTPSFDDIKAVGFRFQVDIGSGSSSTAQPKLGINFFQVNGTTQEPQTDEGKCIIDRDRTYQKMEGFGASVAFYERLMVDHNQTSELADLLFRDLKLDILRVQNVYQHTGSNWTSSFSDFQNTYAAGTNALGRDVKVLLSSWTPPASLKSHNNLWGTYNDVIGTLAKDGSGNYRYADFATWWKDSVDYYRNNGIRVDYVSIQNEPNWHPEYNGCAFEPSETTSRAGYNKALDAVWREFADSYGVLGVPKMIGPETIGINKADEYIDALIHRERMYGYAHHLYQQSPATNPDVLNAQMRQTKDKYDYRPLMQTEYAYLDPHTISDEQRKLNQAKLMHNALTEEGVSVYLYWALFWQMQDQEGLINIPNTPSAAYQINPEYYAFKHFSAFIHEDWRRVYADPGVHGVSVSAFTSPERDRMSVVLINENNTYEYVDMVFSNMNISIGSIYRTDASQDCAVVGFYSPSQSQIEIPPNSITTLDLQTDLLAAPSVTNVLMIAIDDLRPQLRTYGHGQMHTPNLDQLARDGYQFNRAYSQYAVCAPSRASIMTGFRPNMTQTFNYDGNFRDQLPWAQTLPMKLRNNGYTTLGIGKIYHVISGQNDPLTWSNEGSGGWSSGGGISGTTPAQQDGWTYSAYQRHAGTDDSLRDGSVANIASLTLGLLKNQQPFFYGVGFIRPHLPFVAPDAYWDLYSVNDLDIPEITSEPLNGLSYSYDNWTELRPSGGGGYYGIPTSGPVSSDQRRDLIHGYYACVSYVDAQVGRLMGALKEQGLDKNTIVIVWGDHGYHLGENGQWCKHSNFELDTRIPLLIHVPWMPGATQVDALTEALDIYPTILELCGIDRPSFLEGESLVPVMNNPVQTSSTEAVSQYERSNGPTMGYSLRTDRYRYTEWRRAGQTAPVSNGYELYDHFTDPHEDTNIYSAASTTLRNTLASQLATYVPENYGGSDPVYENAFSDLLTGAGLSGVNALVNADPDSDGMSNIEEYAFNLDPTVSDRVMVTVGSGISGMPAPYTYAETNQTQGVNLISNGDFNNGVADGWTYRQGGGAVTSSSVWDGTWVAMQMGTEPVLKLGPNSNAGTELWQLSVNQVVACNPASSYVIKLSAIAQEARDIKIIWRNVADNDSGVYFDSGIISLQNKVVTNLVYNVLPTNLSEVDLNGELRIQVGGDGTRVHIDEVEVIEQASSGSDASSRLAIEYIRRKNASDLTYQPSFESNLSSSNWVDASNHQTATSIDSLWERVRVEDPDASATNSTRFGRLEVLFEYSE